MQVVELDGILTLSPFMGENFTTKLVEAINQQLRLNESEDVLMRSSNATTNDNNHTSVLANPARILGACMQALQRRAHSEWSTQVDIRDWIRTGTKTWSTSPEVLAGLAPLARARFVSSTKYRMLLISRPSTVPHQIPRNHQSSYPRFTLTSNPHSSPTLVLYALMLSGSWTRRNLSRLRMAFKRC